MPNSPRPSQRMRYPNLRYGFCPCGKRGFDGKKAAKTAARIDFPGRHMGFYRCDESVWWHYGNLPSGVIHGAIPRVSGARVRPSSEEASDDRD